jgi:molybdate transport system regulatory protein
MKISARNVFEGKITAVQEGAVNSEVDLATAGGLTIVAIVTNQSVKSLGLRVGAEAVALVKASSVMVLTEGGMKLSARNCLGGTITRVSDGPLSAEVSIGVAGGVEVRATITHDASSELGLRPGVPATAVFKASAVILAVPG